MKDMIAVKTYNTRLEAQIVKGFLEANGIKSLVTGDDEGGMYPFPMQPNSTGVKVFVLKKDREEAVEILKKRINDN